MRENFVVFTKIVIQSYNIHINRISISEIGN